MGNITMARRPARAIAALMAAAACAGTMVSQVGSAGASEPIESDKVTLGSVHWQPNGDWIVFERPSAVGDGNIYIYKVRSDGTGFTQLTSNGYEAGPVWSNNGSRIGFHVNGASEEFWTMDASGGNRISLGLHSDRLNLSGWSPDGLKIAFVKADGPYIGVLDAATGDELSYIGGGFAADWHPGGQYVVVSRNNDQEQMNIYEVDVNTGEARQITTGDSLDENPRYSPDGQWIVYESVRRGAASTAGSAICLINRAGNGGYVLPLGDPDGYEYASPDFSADGQRLVFARGNGAAYDLYTCRLDGTDLRRLTNFYNEQARLKQPGINVAGRPAARKGTLALGKRTDRGLRPAVRPQPRPEPGRKRTPAKRADGGGPRELPPRGGVIKLPVRPEREPSHGGRRARLLVGEVTPLAPGADRVVDG
jgi:dipeptidyl aminopeptidase/acylaminoacyl peptidase